MEGVPVKEQIYLQDDGCLLSYVALFEDSLRLANGTNLRCIE